MADQFQIDCALMAGAVYKKSRNQINILPNPNGWETFNYKTTESGFEAVSFRKGNEIVISFAGTYPRDIKDWVTDYALANGNFCDHLLDAARYYLDIINDESYNGETITFTGQSLGGGLAALMAVFFNESAVTFDQAPFRYSAVDISTEEFPMTVAQTLLKYLLDYSNNEYSAADVAPLQEYINLFNTSGRIPTDRESKVTGFYVEGEVLTSDLPSFYKGIGEQVKLELTATARANVDSWDLHATALIEAFLLDDRFRVVTDTLTNLLSMIFDKKLYCYETDTRDENFIDRLVRYQTGSAPGATASNTNMLNRFTNDLIDIAQQGGLTMSNKNLTDALTAFAMQFYYASPVAVTPSLSGYDITYPELYDVNGVTGGIHFNRGDVTDSLYKAKGYNNYFQQYLSKLPGNETGIITNALPGLLDWYIQAGSAAMEATDHYNRGVFMLGYTGDDILTGGTAADLLYGGTGADNLTGGGGNDTLIGSAGDDILQGGIGHDVYRYTIGDGNDTIIDEDKNGEIIIYKQNGTEIERRAINSFYQAGENEWKLLGGGSIKITQNSPWQIVLEDGGTITLGDNFQWGDFGINLFAEPTNPATTNTILGDLEENKADNIIDTSASDRIEAGIGDDQVRCPNGGANWVLGGAGCDILDGDNSSSCIIEGGEGSDIIFGAVNGSSQLYGDSYGDMEALITAGETATDSGVKGDIVAAGTGGGDNFLYGSDGYDMIFGGTGKDLIVGGGGNDLIYGEITALDVNPGDNYTWSFYINGSTPVISGLSGY
ncbi:MAG: hypothetical protein JW976_08720 [Syntrophaceae bacterium]|nr:hypothetical protein [Syntrophaceae bacterium]